MRKTSRIAALIICLLLGFASLKAQKTIYGKVLDKKDQYPIPGVNVIVLPDSSSGTVTNLSGEFTINVSDSSELVFSTAGYEKLRLPVEKSDTIFVELKMRCFRVLISTRPKERSPRSWALTDQGRPH